MRCNKGVLINWSLVTAFKLVFRYFRNERKRKGVDAMPLVWFRVAEAFASKDVTEMTPACGACNLRPVTVCVPILSYCSGDVCPETWPAATAVKFHIAGVQWCFACSANITAFLEVVVEATFRASDPSRLRALQSHDFELRFSKY